jgi:hypothetical protein
MTFALAALAATIAVGGCRSDESVMAEAKKAVGESCRQGPLPGVDMNSYCNCVADKSVGSKTVDELRKMSEKDGQQLGMDAATQCMAQQGVGGAQTGAAPAEAADAAGEAAEEGVDEAN